MLRIFNTLTKKIEEFKPINPASVGMYTCGPTVYGPQHIGNLRTAIFSDLLYRTLRLNGFNVKSVRNITDIEDKIIKNAAEKNLSIEEFTGEFTKNFFTDLESLNILPDDVNPKATEHIEKMVKYVAELIKKGFAYVEEEGSVYFDISKFPEYGKLSGLKKKNLKTGTRILSDEYSKENVQDFALWKAVKPNEVGYDSPWSRGRPGWHIECSVMSQEYLGESFDLHLGGIDLIFPHHENEIAQSEAKTGNDFVRYFVHGEFLLVDGVKMSKSLKNDYGLKELEESGVEPLAFRYLCLTAHYRDKLNFTWDSLKAAQNALNNLREELRSWNRDGEIDESAMDYFKYSLGNDLNVPQALALLWKLVNSGKDNLGSTVLEMDKVLGLRLEDYLGKILEVPEKIQKLVDQREEARKTGDFKKSDQLRGQIKKLGFEIEDTPSGPKLRSS